MDVFLMQWLMLTAVFAVALVSPGPDFVMALQNSLSHGRRAGMLTALGFGLGIAVHVAYNLAGLAVLIAHSVLLFSIIKYAGAAYLCYVGIKALRSAGWKDQIAAMPPSQKQGKSDLSALRDGFITNILNPKATLFFMALFAQLLTPDTGFVQKLVLGGTCVLMTMVWFAGVAIFMTMPVIRAGYARISQWIDRICGLVLIALGIKLAAARI
jgi:RhtB (resistance to homoserine/threonine) family protein